MTRDDPRHDPRADARIGPLKSLAAMRRRRRDDASPSRWCRKRRIAHGRAPSDLAAEAIVRKPENDRDQNDQRDRRKSEERSCQAEHRKNEQRRDCWSDDRAKSERRRQRRQSRDASAPSSLRRQIGLRSGWGRAAKAAVDRTEKSEQCEGQHTADPAFETAVQHDPAEKHRDDEAADAHNRERLSTMVIALFRP